LFPEHLVLPGFQTALCHHERWDGTGYPYRLSGDEIPLYARIASIADVYDALRTERSYKPAYDHATSVKIITEGDRDGRVRPEHFDPKILDAFWSVRESFDAVYLSLRPVTSASSD
jgi:putative two-component system response regulator